MGEVNEDHTPYIITRGKGKSVVVMSREDYNAMDGTVYLLSSQNIHEPLLNSIAEVEKIGGTLRELIEQGPILFPLALGSNICIGKRQVKNAVENK